MLSFKELVSDALMAKIKSEAITLTTDEGQQIFKKLISNLDDDTKSIIESKFNSELDKIGRIDNMLNNHYTIDWDNTVLVCWSGGLDSTALIGNLLTDGLNVLPVYLVWRKSQYMMREFAAIYNIYQQYQKMPKTHFPGTFYAPIVIDMEPIGEIFKTGENLIPNRNELFVNIVSNVIMKPLGIKKLGTGEYDGADKWVVTWDVPVSDCEPSSFKKWLEQYCSPEATFYYLGTYGKSYYKHNRLYLGLKTFGNDIMKLTTCCLSDTLIDCGICYTCVERHVAYELNNVKDETNYLYNPKESFLYELYLNQMKNESLK